MTYLEREGIARLAVVATAPALGTAVLVNSSPPDIYAFAVFAFGMLLSIVWLTLTMPKRNKS